MKTYVLLYLLLTILTVHSVGINAKTYRDSFLIHTDLPLIKHNKKLLLDIYYFTDSCFNGEFSLSIYKYNNEGDSILVLSKNASSFKFKKGLNKTKIDFCEEDTSLFYERKMFDILKKTNKVPPGSYQTLIKVLNKGKVFSSKYLYNIDSTLISSSPVGKDIDKSLMVHRHRLNYQLKVNSKLNHTKKPRADLAISRARKKVDKAVKKNGLTSIQNSKNGISSVDLYYQDWFAGRYEVKNNESLSDQINQKQQNEKSMDFNSLTNNEPGDPSLFSQYRTINSKKNKDEVKGTLSLITNSGNQQEPNSGVDNNYYELKGMTEMPVMGIPVEIEGLYTSQDNDRKIKSSYFRVHYDVQKAKEDLFKSISSYNSKFIASKSKHNGAEKIYGEAVNKLEKEKVKLIEEIDLQEKSNFDSYLEDHGKDTTALRSTISSRDTSNAKKHKKRDDLHKKLRTINKQIEKYNLLLAQGKNTSYFDSSLGYSKTKNIGNPSEMSYKEMTKVGRNILPDGKAKKFISGVTTMDAGMFSKYDSKYTMAGQMVKGMDFGYDLGFCETNVTAGKTEYVGRDGNLDNYTFYSAKSTFKTIKQQKFSLMYYGYTIDKRLLYSGDAFFDKANISAPSFFEPVHIVSGTYAGGISKYVTLESEVATSQKKADKTPLFSADKMAYRIAVDGNIPNTYVSLSAAYDKMGEGFENNTLPVSMKGTEQYKFTGRNDFFNSFLTLGVELNKLIQNNYASKGSNTKWGFDIKTNSKRYPNVTLSYKPYSTFQSHTDTLGISQRSMIGSVWAGKTSYQIKRNTTSWRFSLLYTECKTITDSLQYGNSTLQMSCMFSDKRLTSAFGGGI